MHDRKEQVRQIVERHFMEMAYNLEAIGAVLPTEAWTEARRIVNRLIGANEEPVLENPLSRANPPLLEETRDLDSEAAQQRIMGVG